MGYRTGLEKGYRLGLGKSRGLAWGKGNQRGMGSHLVLGQGMGHPMAMHPAKKMPGMALLKALRKPMLREWARKYPLRCQ